MCKYEEKTCRGTQTVNTDVGKNFSEKTSVLL